MKKSTLFSFVFFLSIIFLNACSKVDQLAPVTDPSEQNPAVPLSGQVFDELNETIARFDPLYLQIMYKDKRSKEVLNEEALRLMMAINQDSTSLPTQEALVELFHFKSFSDLQIASHLISVHSALIKNRLMGNETTLSNEKLKQLYEARTLFFKNKVLALQKASQKQSSGLWTDNAAWILNELHYYSQVANLELGLEMDGGVGTGTACNESCCFEYKGCLISAASNYRENFVQIGVFLAASGGSLGALYGSIIPFVGTGAVGLAGGILGGVAGFVQAVNIYMKNQEACVYNYKACILRKNGN